jgi:hypothetical protein
VDSAVGEAVDNAVGEAVGEAVEDALRSVVVSGSLPSASVVLSWFSGVVFSVRPGEGSSGPNVTAAAHPTPTEITVAARAHAAAPATTAIKRIHPRIHPRRQSHRIKADAPRIKVNAANSATSIVAVPISSITTDSTSPSR